MRRMYTLLTSLTFILSIIPSPIFGQAGILDFKFGDEGIVIKDIFGHTEYCGDVAIRNDGQIFVYGRTDDNDLHSSSAFIVSFNPDGTVNNTFGNKGFVIEPLNSFNISASIKILADESILISGNGTWDSHRGIYLIKYNNDGILDSSFRRNFITLNDSNFYGGGAFEIQDDGKIIVVGYSKINTNYNFILFRYLSNGKFDSSFGINGIVETDLTSYDIGVSIAIQGDGKILIAGYNNTGGDDDFIVLRYNSDGTLDGTFGENGFINTNLDGDSFSPIILIQPDNKILLGGTNNYNFALVRLNPDGTKDEKFGNQGVVTTSFGKIALVNDLGMQSDGKIVLGGFLHNAIEVWNPSVALARYNTDGLLDNSFGNEGKVVLNRYATTGRAVAIQPDNNIVVLGECYNISSGNSDILIARYLSDSIAGNSNNSINEDFTIYPNPVKNKTQLKYLINEESEISIQLLDITGKIIKVLIKDEYRTPGEKMEELILPNNLTGGVYLIRVILVIDNKSIINTLKLIVE